MNTNAVSYAVVLDFLGNKFPFSELDRQALTKFAQKATIDFFPKGTLILRQGESEVTHFYVIQRGGVKSYRVNNSGDMILKDFRGEGEHFGALSIIQNTGANFNVETLDEQLEGMPLVTERRDNVELNTVLTNNFGFGGTNACLVLRKFKS